MFKKTKKNNIYTLINSKSEVNIMTLVYASKLGFKTRHTNILAQKIVGFTLEIYEMVLASFQAEDKLGWA